MKHINPKTKVWYCGSSGFKIGFALIILIIGIYWLAKDMGWIKPQISIWSILFIALGLYWIIKAVMMKVLSH